MNGWRDWGIGKPGEEVSGKEEGREKQEGDCESMEWTRYHHDETRETQNTAVAIQGLSELSSRTRTTTTLDTPPTRKTRHGQMHAHYIT